MTKELDLDTTTLDWFLPNNHERVWWSQFLRGGRTFLDVGAHVGTWTLNIDPIVLRCLDCGAEFR